MWTGDKVMDSLFLEVFEQLGRTLANDDKEGTSLWGVGRSWTSPHPHHDSFDSSTP